MRVHWLFLPLSAMVGFAGGAAFAAPPRRGLSMLPRKRGPLPCAALVDWERFVAVMACAPKSHVSPRYKLGAFQLDVRRLKDVGLMSHAGKGVYGDEEGVWMGKWVPPLTEDRFLGSMPLQYAAFTKSCEAMAPKVSGYEGVEVEGVRCSLSGLLGVGHMAGEAGVPSWVESASVRKRFPRTTEMFRRTNGIF